MSDSDIDESVAHVDPVVAELLRVKQENDRLEAKRLAGISNLSSLIEKDKTTLYNWEIELLLANVPTSGLSHREIEEIEKRIKDIKDRIERDTLELTRLQDNE